MSRQEMQTRMTWRNIRDAIDNGVPNSRLDEPAQFVLAPLDGDEPAPTMPALTFAKSKDLFNSEDDPGIRSHYDNQDHPGDYLILLDENPYDDQGRTVLSMEEVEEDLKLLKRAKDEPDVAEVRMSITPAALDYAAELIAGRLIGLPQAEKNNQLIRMKQRNPTLHSVVKQKMMELRNPGST